MGGGGAPLSLLLPGSLLQFHPVPSARLGVRELRDLGDLISIHCREPTWKPRAGLEALEGCSRRGNSSPGRPPPPPACRIQASQVPCSARPPRAKRLLIPLTCGKCKLRGKPWEIKPPERKPAPPTHKANTPHPAATQSPAHPGGKKKKERCYLRPSRVWVIRVSARSVGLFSKYKHISLYLILHIFHR